MKTPHPPNVFQALIPIVFMMASIIICTVLWDIEPHIPIVASCVVAACVAAWCGFTWKDIISGMLDSIARATEALLIIMIVGMLIGSWVMCGTMPAMVYYGLAIIKPQAFLAIGVTLVFIVGLATGSSWTASGTVGVALMGIATGLGIYEPLAAGMVISGAYMGDKWSPLSDSTNIAAATAETPLYSHVRAMMVTTFPTFIIAFILYAIVGVKTGGGSYDPHMVKEIQEAIFNEFYISWWIICPTLVVIFAAVKKIPAIPSLLAAAGFGALISLFVQHRSIADVIMSFHYGYETETGIYIVDKLLNRGGVDSMMWTISLILFALSFGGILDKCGFIQTLLGGLVAKIKSNAALVAATMVTGIICDFVLTDQYLSIIVPGRMYMKAYDDRNLDRSFLSRTLEDAGTLWSPMVPWNGCGAYQAATLGVPTFRYFPFAFVNLLNPFVAVLLTSLGIGVRHKDESDYKGFFSIFKKKK